MKNKNYLFLLCVLFAFGACKKSEELDAEIDYDPITNIPGQYQVDNSFKIVAYMPSYKDPALVADTKYKMITHLFYAFLEPADVGDGSLKPLSQQNRFFAVQEKAKLYKIKFGISVSGNKTNFENIAKNANARTNFVNNIINFAKINNLNGVDMDWEYPTTAIGIESADNYTLLMKELNAALHKEGKFLSAAVTPGVYAGTIRDGIKPEVLPYMDFVNIMQYDGAGYDRDDINQHASYKMSEASLDYWIGTKGLPKLKAIVGMPLYGRSTTGVSRAFRDIEVAGNDTNLDFGTVAGVTFWYNGKSLIKRKTQLAKDRANGIMFWEFSHDSNTENSLLKAANDQLGRAY